METKESTETCELHIKANDIRKDILDMSREVNNGHIASALSVVEILISLYRLADENDRIILSKGHGCMALYAILKRIDKKPVCNHHPDIDTNNGIVCTTGSLGHGLPIAIGMALAKKKGKKTGNVYVVISDGELQEGTTWESLQIARHHCLDNLIIIIDNNKIQALDWVDKICNVYPILDKIRSFGLSVCETNGHDIELLIETIIYMYIESPIVIIANTIKGKGIPFMENKPEWHNRLLSDEEYSKACEELLENG